MADFAAPTVESVTPPEPKVPTADEFFGQSSLPTADQFFGAQQPLSITGAHLPGQKSPPLSGAAYDDFFTHSPAGRVLSMFGQGMKEGWGAAPVGLSDEDEKSLREQGVFNDYAKNQTSGIKSFNEAIIRPLAQAWSIAGLAPMAAITGVAAAAGQVAEETGLAKAVGLPGGQLARDIAGIAVQEGASPVRGGMPSLEQAKDLKVISEGEAGWEGTAPEPTDAAGKVVRLAEEPQEEAPVAGQPPAGEEAPSAAAAPTEAHPVTADSVARTIAPETMARYDALSGRRDTYRAWLADLDQKRRDEAEASPRAKELRDSIDGMLAKVGGREADLTKAAAGRLRAARDELDGLLNPEADSPDMARIRQAILKADRGMRDLAPDVSAAYARARELVPEDEANADTGREGSNIGVGETRSADDVPVRSGENEPVSPVPAEEPPRAAEEGQVAAEPANAELPGEAAPVDHRAFIANDISHKLIAAGRPEDEANAAAQIVASRYEARAARLGISVEEAYRERMPDIVGKNKRGKERVTELGTMGYTDFKPGERAVVALYRGKADASTFLHEMGHVWLEELLDDASDERANAQLKGDVRTVKDWLGMKEGEPTTRQHEKFARGFERYLYEGAAPTPGLARVFAQFKEWMGTLYARLKDLGNTTRMPKLNDEIRDVFDRLIAKNPERQQAGTKSPEDLLSSIHEADAEAVPPQHADPVGDQIEGEIEHANGGGVAGEAGPGTEDAGRPPIGPADAGSGSRDGAREPAAVAEGAGEGAAEGAGLRQEPSQGESGPNQPLPAGDTELLDKAGNIRLDNLNAPEDIKDVLRQTAERNGDFMRARRGVVSDAQVLELADALGTDPQFVDRWKIGRAFNAEEIKALQKLLGQSAVAVRDAARKAATGSDEDVIAFGQAKARHQMIQEQYAAVTAEGGRALRAFSKTHEFFEAGTEGIDVFVREATGKTLFQMRQEAQAAANLQTPAQISRFMNDARKPTFSNMVQEYFVNNLISGPATHTTYMIGNSLLSLHKALLEKPAEALVGAAREAIGLEHGERAHFGEVGADLWGMMRGYRDGLSAAWEAFKTNKTASLPGEEARPDLGYKPMEAIPGLLGQAVRLPSRGVTAIHSMYRVMNYEREVAARSYRMAANEGLEGQAFADRVAELRGNPPEELMEAARTEANALTLMRKPEYGSAMYHLERVSNSSLPVKLILPFVRIGTNIVREALVERTLIGLASSDVRNNLLGRNGEVQQSAQMARIGMGSAIAATTIGLAMEGLVTGAGPQDYKQRRVLEQTGWQAFSVKFGDTYVPYKRLGVLGMIMGTAAEGYELGHEMTNEEIGKWGASISLAMSETVINETWMRGLSDLAKAINDPVRYGGTWIKNLATDFVPYSIAMSQIGSATDPYVRQARTILDAVKRRIPGYRETLLPSRDIYGEPIENKPAVLHAGVTALYESQEKHDPVTDELLHLGVYPSSLPRNIRGVPLSDQQYDDFQRISGRYMKMRLDAIVKTPGWQTVPDATRRQTILSAISQAREAGRTAVMMQYPNIITDATNAKMARATGAKRP